LHVLHSDIKIGLYPEKLQNNWEPLTHLYIRRITPKRVTSLRAHFREVAPRHTDSILAEDVEIETVTNCLQRCVTFGRPRIWTPNLPHKALATFLEQIIREIPTSLFAKRPQRITFLP